MSRRRPSASPLRWTVVPTKLELFGEEPGGFLAAGAATAWEVLGEALDELLVHLAVLVVQPDTIARRQIELCLAVLTDHGFRPVRAVPVLLDETMAAALWRFQFTAITTDSRAIGALVYCRSSSLVLLLADDRPEHGLPASTRLTRLKGSSDPQRRTDAHLRSVLGTINKIVGGVHCPDEPIDIVRELAILFDEPTRRALYEGMAQHIADGDGTGADAGPSIRRLYDETPAHDLHVDRATERLLDAVARAPKRRDAARRVTDMVHAASCGGATLRWHEFADDLRALGIDPTGWDPVLVGSHLARYEQPGGRKLIESFSTP